LTVAHFHYQTNQLQRLQVYMFSRHLTLQAIRNMVRKHPKAHAKLVEDKANGPAIISMLKNEIGGMIPVNPQGGKVARVNAVSPYIESGNVYLPRQAPWVHDFVEECASFPNGKNDDQTDAMSQALNRYS
ncbi:phage terminase large subunit, partial [Escherichia sp. R-CC3]